MTSALVYEDGSKETTHSREKKFCPEVVLVSNGKVLKYKLDPALDTSNSALIKTSDGRKAFLVKEGACFVRF